MKKRTSKKIYFAVYVQIILMISMTVSMSYMISQLGDEKVIMIEKEIDNERVLLKALKIFNNIFWNENNLVSASASETLNDTINTVDDYIAGYEGESSINTEISSLDMESGVYTCPKDNKGRICQEYPSSTCAANCNVSCLPTIASKSSTCKAGTCYDSNEGICAIGATRQTCEDKNGLWFADPLGNINVCKAGCCVLGEEAIFVTERQCQKEEMVKGIESYFRPELKTEIACLALSKVAQEEGACVLEDPLGNSCRFTTKTNCELNIKGKFYSGFLCSNPDFGTKCIKQKTTGCVEGKDEVYWFDSCGNRENIYSVNKEQSYNNGKILSKPDSCSLDINNKQSQSICGNCNYFAGSKCREKTQTEKLSESNAEFVCRDLSCIDEEGNTRKHGESWCISQGSINLDEGVNGARATTTVGSRSFKKSCYEGEIVTDPCADFDNEICTQSEVERDDGSKFSVAACRTNRAYECYQYNKEGMKDKCTDNPDCFIKKVSLEDNFNFDLCVPKYSPGFDMMDRGESAATICSFATQKCQVVEVKGLGGWGCKANCECKETQKFAEQMNDMCISLGDCGTKANYMGDLAVNHKVFKSRDEGSLGSTIGGEYFGLSNNYINKLTSYANEKIIDENYIEAPDLSEFYKTLGIPGTLGIPLDMGEDKTAAVAGQIQMISGVMGVVMMVANTQIGLSALSHVGLSIALQGPTVAGGAGLGFAPTATMTAFSGALAGAAIGFAVVSFLISWTGVGRGLPEGLTYALMGIGAAAGAVIGIAAMSTTAGTGIVGSLAATTGLTAGGAGAAGIGPGMAAAAAVAWVAIIVVIVVIIIFALLGIGKVRKTYYTFQCLPWEAPSGGSKCSECGKDGYTCSKYSCQSLGQNCQLINEETEKPECINVNKNDATEPIIRLNESYFPEGYKVEYSDNGAKIITNDESGCVPESYDMLLAGIDIDQASQCLLYTNIDDATSEDSSEGGEYLSSGLYRKLHFVPITVPALSTFGLENFEPGVRAETTYHVICEDKAGNKNTKTYGINFCIMPSKDITPVRILSRDPFYEIVGHNVTEVRGAVLTSEPADCKWSKEDKEYENMENNFTCANDFAQREGIFGWRCADTFRIDSDEENYYVRCLDQPWIMKGYNETGNYTDRNANTQSYVFKLKRAEKPLTIDSINIDNSILEYNVTPASVEIIVKTSGGLDGTAKCGYVWGENTIDFLETLSNEHKQTSPAYFPGEYALTIKCEDRIGESAEKTAHFQINMDDNAPLVTRAYSNLGTLYVVTDEESNCYYNENTEQDCYFDIFDQNKSKQMSGSSSKVHTLELKYGMTYNIKCVDEFGHYDGECSSVIKGVGL